MADNKYKVSSEFLDAWSKNSADRLVEAKARVDAYSVAYSAASKLVDDYIKATPGDAAEKARFDAQYTSTGPGIDFDKSGIRLEPLVNKIKDWNGSLLPTNDLKSNRGANTWYAKLQALIAKSPDDIFAADAQLIRAKTLAITPPFTGDLDEDAFNSLGLENTQIDNIVPLGFLVNEYNAFNKSTPATSPSGPVNEAKPAEPAPTSPINAAEKGEKAKASSTLNPEKSATVPLETTTGTVTAGKSELPKEVGKGPETGAPAVVVNVESAAPNLPASPAPAAAAPSMPTVASSPVNSSKETVTNNVTNNNTSAEKNTASPIVAGDAIKKYLAPTSKTTNKTNVTGSTINNLSESDAQLLKNFIEGDSNQITSATNSSVSNTTTSATNSSVSNTTTSATNSSVNEITPKEEKIIEKSSESNAYSDIVDINNISSGDAELLKKYAGFDVNSPKKDAGDKTGSTEVVKTKPALPAVKTPEVKAPLPAEPIDKKTEPVTAKEEKSESSETESPATPASMPTEYAAEQTSTQASMNTEDIEARLARIEYLLSGTLDVKIVD